MIKKYSASPLTLTSAIAFLEGQGLIVTYWGYGSLVADPTKNHPPLPPRIRMITETTHLIATGYYKPGDQLPTEPEFAQMYGLSQKTVHVTLARLDQVGLTRTFTRRGRIVQPFPGAKAPRLDLIHPGKPLHRKVAEQIAKDISACKPGQQIPTTEQLTKRHGVSKQSILTALAYLNGKGIIESRRLGGTFIADPMPNPTRSI